MDGGLREERERVLRLADTIIAGREWKVVELARGNGK